MESSLAGSLVLRSALLGASIAASAALSLSQSAPDARAGGQSQPAATYTVLSPSAVRPLELVEVERIELGANKSGRPGIVTDVLMLSGRIFVLDGMAHSLLVYDSRGRLLKRAAEWGENDGSLQTPIRLVGVGDTVLVLDVTHHNAVSAFDGNGSYLGARLPDLHNAAANSVAFDGGRAYLATMRPADRPDEPVVSILNLRGRGFGFGCPRDPGYAKSERGRGVLAHFTASDVAVRDGHVYCVQAIAPGVTELDRSGNMLRRVAVAPPFYAAPTDIPDTRNQKVLMEYQSTWTAVDRLFMLPKGFVQFFTRFNLDTRQIVYTLFACDLNETLERCRAGASPGTALRVMPPGTVLAVVNERNGSTTLRVLRMGRP